MVNADRLEDLVVAAVDGDTSARKKVMEMVEDAVANGSLSERYRDALPKLWNHPAGAAGIKAGMELVLAKQKEGSRSQTG